MWEYLRGLVCPQSPKPTSVTVRVKDAPNFLRPYRGFLLIKNDDFENGCGFIFRRRNFPKKWWFSLQKPNFWSQKYLFLIRTVPYE